MSDQCFAAVEAGGTKILCAVADEQGTVLKQLRIATLTPDENFPEMAGFFDAARIEFGALSAAGIGSFGPIDLDPASADYGTIGTTPKPGWSSINMLDAMRDMLGVPIAIETDVNCAAIAEARHGAGCDVDRLCYVTVGTGIGVGVVEQGAAMRGGHAEAGHIRVARASDDEHFAGVCHYHGDCLEGLACGPAIEQRWGKGAEQLEPGHAAWAMEAHYLACLCVNLTYTLRPQRIILGGGVNEQQGLLPRVRAAFAELAAGYSLDRWSGDEARYICPPALTDPSPGLTGALDLARDLAQKKPA